MALHYSNVTVIGPRRDAVEAWVRSTRRRAWLSPTVRRTTTVFDAECDSLSTAAIEDFVIEISADLGCTAFAVLNDGDTLLMYWLAEDGALLDSFLRARQTRGGNARRLSHSLGGDRHIVHELLHGDLPQPREIQHLRLVHAPIARAKHLHNQLVEALGLPDYGVDRSWSSLECGDAKAGWQRVGDSDRGRLPEYLRLV